jgi:phage terminase large subunit-like protein
MSNLNLDLLTSSEKQELLSLLEEKARRESRRRLLTLFPSSGPLRRDLYPRHLEHFGMGVEHRERLFLAANRVGKTVAGAYETALHLTGLYPDWWPGKRFSTPVRWWAAGKTNETTRDIVQHELLGPVAFDGNRKAFAGTGMVPGDNIGSIGWKAGVPDLADRVAIKHASGGWSQLGIKSYQQGRGSFEGTAQDGIWDDEEPPIDIYTEQLLRTMTTGGMMILTFTPLEGMSEVVLSFLVDGKIPERAV